MLPDTLGTLENVGGRNAKDALWKSLELREAGSHSGPQELPAERVFSQARSLCILLQSPASPVREP